MQALLQESLSVATRTEAIKPSELSRVIVDTTVQPKNVMFPTDARLLNRAREKLVRLAQRHGVRLAPVLCAGGQVRPDPASALCPCQAVQARQPGAEEAAHLSRPRHPRHRPQDRGRRRARSGVRTSCYCWRGACASSSNVSAGRRSIPCMRRKSNASARARPIGLTSSASRSRVATTSPRQGRPVRHPCEGAARQSL